MAALIIFFRFQFMSMVLYFFGESTTCKTAKTEDSVFLKTFTVWSVSNTFHHQSRKNLFSIQKKVFNEIMVHSTSKIYALFKSNFFISLKLYLCTWSWKRNRRIIALNFWPEKKKIFVLNHWCHKRTTLRIIGYCTNKSVIDVLLLSFCCSKICD